MKSVGLPTKGLVPLRRDDGTGTIVEDGQRILTFRVTTFQALVERLRKLVGEEVSRTVLNQLGLSIGETAFNYSKASINSDQDQVNMMDRALRTRGWGRCLDVSPLDPDTYQVTIGDCVLCHQEVSDRPRCDLMRGTVGGWLQSYLGRKARDSIELQCRASGGAACVFRITFENTHLTPEAIN